MFELTEAVSNTSRFLEQRRCVVEISNAYNRSSFDSSIVSTTAHVLKCCESMSSKQEFSSEMVLDVDIV